MYYVHGESHTPLHKMWSMMKQRCCNPNAVGYDDYGGRGIRILIDWADSYIVFRNWALANGYKEGLEIDRKNNDGNYTPDNCRFVTRQINALNRRKLSNSTSLFRGVSWHKRCKCWYVAIRLNGRTEHIGYFKSELLAALSYDYAAYSAHGNNAKLNFPERYTLT